MGPTREDRVEALAKKMVEKYNSKQPPVPVRDWGIFSFEATVAVEMFWPLVESAVKLNAQGARGITGVLDALAGLDQ